MGITGTPGAGKSTLTSALVARCRAAGLRVGVVAVDPSSPFSGGAILGDRIRMQAHFGDPGVFIRSVATRGALGGLSRTAADVALVLAAWGADVVFLETVGVGQDELEVTFLADTTLVVVAPGLGDDVQALKAGILECADVFAVNKADRPGADAAVRDLQLMLALSAESRLATSGSGQGEEAARYGAVESARHGYGGPHGHPGGPLHGRVAGGVQGQAGGRPHGHAGTPSASATPSAAGPQHWTPPIVRTVALRDEGVDELYGELSRHRSHAVAPDRVRHRFRNRLAAQLRGQFGDSLEGTLAEALDESAAKLATGASDPYTECEALWRALRER